MEWDSCFLKIKTWSNELLQQDLPRNVDEIIHNLFSEIQIFEKMGGVTIHNHEQVEENAVKLWNWAITKHLGSAINEEQLAKVQHVSCRLVFSFEILKPAEATIRRRILMAVKTGRSWLDCKKATLADDFFQVALQFLEILYGQLINRREGNVDFNIIKGDVEKDIFRVLCYQAESDVIQGFQELAVSCLLRCKDILSRLPNEARYLSMLCYNFGIDTYKLKKFEDSSFWLGQSYEIAKFDKTFVLGCDVKAKVLRMLATVYLEWDVEKYQDKAISAITLANEEYVHPSGICLELKILLKCGSPDESVNKVAAKLFDSNVSLDVCLSTITQFLEDGREALAFNFMKTVCMHFEDCPEIGKALLMHIELLLQRGKELLAKQKIENLITGCRNGKQLSSETLDQLHLLLWDKAEKNFEAEKYQESLQWYNYSLNFYSPGQLDKNLGKLQRNRASCYLQLQQMEMANEAIKEAERCDPENIFTQFSIYKIAVLENCEERAFQALRSMGNLLENPIRNENGMLTAGITASQLLNLTAQIALESNKEDLAIKALQYLCEQSEDIKHIFTPLRCLVRLIISKLTSEDAGARGMHFDVIQTYIKMALQKISLLNPREDSSLEIKTEEANWFRKIAWNLALECEGYPPLMKDFFVLSYQLSEYCTSDVPGLIGKKTCLLMIAASCLELGRISRHSDHEKENSLALEYLHICKDIWRTLKISSNSSKDPTDIIMLLYEFEARAKLNDPKLETVLESVLELPQIEPKALQTIASLAMESPAYFPFLCKKALRIALSLLRKCQDTDIVQCSQCLHSLIQLSLPTGVLEMESQVLEEAWSYYEDAKIIINSTTGSYPEVEILWLLTKAWNTGILLYSINKYTEAEKWCGLGMSFLRHLGSLQESYEAQMTGLYAELLERLDTSKKSIVTEE
ncbi:testis-expressed protein 11 [Erpetoichthys calabaricus]|uniref:testis-expressed protein 11 n=1 Tax=Erpetoichthys calabaricus TaxID=27687 RepID=UPI002234462C|nr:testis-expressed protein 11 [Erpetoichthys calabaricus]